MRLKSLELTGFKSFAKKSELEFTSPISAIVGPNGSGKSNIAEAFRFVLGEQSMKSMRGKKSEDLIFNGSRSQPRGNRASVRATFDNSDRLLDIDFPTVTIERVVHRNADNEYNINDSSVRLKDIQGLMASANIGTSSHHIISQGEADRILRVNPRERKQIVEDALGLQVYHNKKKESIRKLERTDENLKEIKSLKREIQPHLTFLTKEIEKIERAEEIRSDLTERYRTYFAGEVRRIEAEKKILDEGTREPKEKLAKLEQELAELRSRQEKEPKIVSEDVRTQEQDLERIRTALKETSERSQELLQNLGRLEGEKSSLERLTSTRPQQIEGRVPKERVMSFLKTLTDLTSQDNSAETLLGSVREAIKTFKDSLTTQESEAPHDTSEMEERMRELKEEMSSLEGEVAALATKELELKKREEEIVKALQKEKTQELENENKKLHLEREIERLRGEVRVIKEREARHQTDADELKEMLGEAGVICGRRAISYEDIHDYTRDRGGLREQKKELERLKIRLEETGVGSGSEIKREYEEVTERNEFLAREIADLEESRDSLLNLIDDLEATLEKKFTEGVKIISKEFEKYFALLFDGGRASLVLTRESDAEQTDEDSEAASDIQEERENEMSEGLDIDVQLPHKRVRGLQVLSGGERALTSIALLFAMSSVNPPPFVILDETDAALDEANSRRYGDMIEELSKDSQLILITHNRETMSRAGLLYGVTMGSDGVSKLLSIKFEEAVRVAK